jgi:malate dehydrogenase (oxaloacetate-decarboxylating)
MSAMGGLRDPHARPILQRYRDELLTFNNDIQGTAAVALGAVLGAVKVTGKSLKDQQIVMLGAGSAGIGVATSGSWTTMVFCIRGEKT